MNWLYFFAGCVVGVLVGVLIGALMAVAHDDDEQELEPPQ